MDKEVKLMIESLVRERLNEALVTFGGRAYPKFNNVLILAGASGSGKDFSLANQIGFEGKVIDIDRFKELATKDYDRLSTKGEGGLARRDSYFKKLTGKRLRDIDFSNSDDVGNLHQELGSNGANYKDRVINSIIGNSSCSDRKPNIIFNETIKDSWAFDEVVDNCEYGGYDKSNIHLVWVLNDF